MSSIIYRTIMKVVCINNKIIKIGNSYHLGAGLVEDKVYEEEGMIVNAHGCLDYIIVGLGRKLVERFKPVSNYVDEYIKRKLWEE